MQVADILGYTIASRCRAAVSEASATSRDASAEDVAESVGSKLLEAVHAAGHGNSEPLPSIDELLEDASSLSAAGSHSGNGTQPDRARSGRRWAGTRWGGGDIINGASLRSRAHHLSDTQGLHPSWSVTSNGRKRYLDVRDLDNESYGISASRSSERRFLSRSDLELLLSESSESRDSI
jgi:hypothetical protein